MAEAIEVKRNQIETVTKVSDAEFSTKDLQPKNKWKKLFATGLKFVRKKGKRNKKGSESEKSEELYETGLEKHMIKVTKDINSNNEVPYSNTFPRQSFVSGKLITNHDEGMLTIESNHSTVLEKEIITSIGLADDLNNNHTKVQDSSMIRSSSLDIGINNIENNQEQEKVNSKMEVGVTNLPTIHNGDPEEKKQNLIKYGTSLSPFEYICQNKYTLHNINTTEHAKTLFKEISQTQDKEILHWNEQLRNLLTHSLEFGKDNDEENKSPADYSLQEKSCNTCDATTLSLLPSNDKNSEINCLHNESKDKCNINPSGNLNATNEGILNNVANEKNDITTSIPPDTDLNVSNDINEVTNNNNDSNIPQQNDLYVLFALTRYENHGVAQDNLQEKEKELDLTRIDKDIEENKLLHKKKKKTGCNDINSEIVNNNNENVLVDIDSKSHSNVNSNVIPKSNSNDTNRSISDFGNITGSNKKNVIIVNEPNSNIINDINLNVTNKINVITNSNSQGSYSNTDNVLSQPENIDNSPNIDNAKLPESQERSTKTANADIQKESLYSNEDSENNSDNANVSQLRFTVKEKDLHTKEYNDKVGEDGELYTTMEAPKKCFAKQKSKDDSNVRCKPRTQRSANQRSKSMDFGYSLKTIEHGKSSDDCLLQEELNSISDLIRIASIPAIDKKMIKKRHPFKKRKRFSKSVNDIYSTVVSDTIFDVLPDNSNTPDNNYLIIINEGNSNNSNLNPLNDLLTHVNKPDNSTEDIFKISIPPTAQTLFIEIPTTVNPVLHQNSNSNCNTKKNLTPTNQI